MENGTIDALNNNDDRDYETTRYITFTNNPIEIKYRRGAPLRILWNRLAVRLFYSLVIC